jgi:cytochrome c peroxidase
LCGLLLFLGAGCDATPDGSTDRDRPTAHAPTKNPWSEAELTLLESLAIGALPRAPSQPSNRVADDPGAAELGHRLFFDPLLSADGRVSCATCHLPERHFTNGRTTSRGLAETTRNVPTLIGAAHSPWMFWDGRRDSLWAQALAPLEAAAEMGSTRLAVVRRIASEPGLAALYTRTFGSLPAPDQLAKWPESAGPFGDRDERAVWQRMSVQDRRFIDRAFANTGKAIAAYERLLRPGESRFDRYVKALRGDASNDAAAAILGDEEIRGLRLFIDTGRTLCLRCHNGPLLTNQSFHDVGTELGRGGLPDFGRFLGIQAVLIDPFNCLGAFSDAQPDQCQELRFLDKAHVGGEMGKFKTPTLRGLVRTGPYMHDGRFENLAEVVDHYRSPPAGSGAIEITPLDIDDDEIRALLAFLNSLDGDADVPDRWLRPPPGNASAGSR